tara:strand:- start:19909 stop:20445 length:537 start_codon:yes stop_codon:yes gene_type:complete
MKLLKGNKSGLTLIESLAVIGLAALVIAGALILFGNAQDARRVTAETTNISNVLKRMEEVFGEDPLDTPITMEEMIIAGVFNASMKQTASTVTNSWSGDVTVTPTGISTYDLTYTNVPTGEVCIDLIRGTRKVGFDRISSTGGLDEDVTDMTISQIIANCDDAGGTNYVNITWSTDVP